jgi:plastocyanin
MRPIRAIVVPRDSEGRSRAVCPTNLAAGLVILLISVCGGLSLGGCGSAPKSTVRQAADPSGRLRFAEPSLHADAGKVKFVFTDASIVPHNLTIERGSHGPNIASTPIFRSGYRTLTAALKPGRYTFYCDVPGHRQAGMQGTITVR